MKNIETCGAHGLHKETVENVKKSILKDETINDLAMFFKVFGDPTRIKIMYALYLGEMCVCDIATSLHLSQSAASHQLRTLKTARLVKYRREGKAIYYSLDDDHVIKVLEQGISHITHI
ncbi:MAG: transcriptional regulator [Alkaliphilus sp.]|nr:MAG: transcriptional regulator [Alkaliphilus sp.]